MPGDCWVVVSSSSSPSSLLLLLLLPPLFFFNGSSCSKLCSLQASSSSTVPHAQETWVMLSMFAMYFPNHSNNSLHNTSIHKDYWSRQLWHLVTRWVPNHASNKLFSLPFVYPCNQTKGVYCSMVMNSDIVVCLYSSSIRYMNKAKISCFCSRCRKLVLFFPP